ncbi:DNA recombination protein RmuC [Sphingosinicella soli]|uniref:DNA recombination protein RmuC homolog n=1 Tax=Sphingosinicella soli TaxID=333708 RepID=A0A7W7B198_9SPHN|nr:DNA recombination protein RmuC [Sphingosinicella soli]MBB4632039.1 DNA recombination protein RmuC [Sphingosinicella soli]
MTTAHLLVGLLALLVGIAAGWWLWGRAAARHLEKFLAAIRDLDAAKREVEALAPLRAENARLRDVEIEHAGFIAAAAERDRQHADHLLRLEKQFGALAQDVLDKSQESFVKRAEETLKRHREAASDGLEKNKLALTELLQPVKETLSRYETSLKEIETARHGAYEGLREQIGLMREGQERVSGEAARLVHALRNAPKARGRWGEHQLRRVLEMAGLSSQVDFAEEVSVDTGDGRLRPDAVIKLPGGKSLVIDAKCSLVAYQDAVDSADEGERTRHLKIHAATIRGHVGALSRKAYWEQFESTPDFVIMFIPGENFLAAALETDHDLFEAAFAQKILLASPTNLIAIARTVAMVWRQEKIEEQARDIATLGKELYERLATMGGHVGRLGKNLETATSAYNAFVGSLESQVLTSAQRFRDLSIEPPKKEIERLPVIETTPRALTKLMPPAEAAE